MLHVIMWRNNRAVNVALAKYLQTDSFDKLMDEVYEKYNFNWWQWFYWQ